MEKNKFYFQELCNLLLLFNCPSLTILTWFDTAEKNARKGKERILTHGLPLEFPTKRCFGVLFACTQIARASFIEESSNNNFDDLLTCTCAYASREPIFLKLLPYWKHFFDWKKWEIISDIFFYSNAHIRMGFHKNTYFYLFLPNIIG